MQFPTAAAKKGSTFSYSLPTGRLAIVTEQHLRLLLSLLLIPAQIFHLYYLDIFLQLGMYIYNEILELSKNILPSTTQFR